MTCICSDDVRHQRWCCIWCLMDMNDEFTESEALGILA